MRKGKIPQTIRFDESLFSEIEEISKENHTSINATVNRIVEEFFKNRNYRSRNEGGADLREEVLDFFKSDEGQELLKDLFEKMKKEDAD